MRRNSKGFKRFVLTAAQGQMQGSCCTSVLILRDAVVDCVRVMARKMRSVVTIHDQRH